MHVISDPRIDAPAWVTGDDGVGSSRGTPTQNIVTLLKPPTFWLATGLSQITNSAASAAFFLFVSLHFLSVCLPLPFTTTSLHPRELHHNGAATTTFPVQRIDA